MALLAPWRELKAPHRRRARRRRPADRATSSTSATGVHQTTPVDNVRRLVEHVGERTSRAQVRHDPVVSIRPRGRAPIGVLIMAYGGPVLARGDAGLPRRHPLRPADQPGGARGDLRQLRGDRRPLAAARDLAPPGRRRAGSARPGPLPLLSRHAALGAVDRGGRRRDARRRHHARRQRRARAALQRAVGREVRRQDRRGPRSLPRRASPSSTCTSYHDRPRLDRGALGARATTASRAGREGQRDRVHVVFSAHSLPVRILAAGDPYDQQLRETARLVAEHAGLGADRWSWSFQSAGRTPEPWLGPQIERPHRRRSPPAA